MESLVLHTGAPTVHRVDNTNCIYFAGSRIVTPIGKYVYIPVCILQEQFDNGIFVPKYENYSVISEYMCTQAMLRSDHQSDY